MPPRLAVLSFRRLYASQDMADGAFGPGWWSWADARGGVNAAGGFDLFGPDARHATFAPRRRRRLRHARRTSTSTPRPTAMAQHLRWGRRSPYFGQTWIFRRGLLREVVGPFVGSTTFHHDRQSRLVRLDHDSGRSVELVWVGRTRRPAAGQRRAPGEVPLRPPRPPRRGAQRGVAGDLRRRRAGPHPIDHRRRRRADGGDDVRRRRPRRRPDLPDRADHPLRLRAGHAHDALRRVAQPDLGVHPRRAGPRRDVRHGRRAALQPPLRPVRTGHRAARARRHVGTHDRAHRRACCASSSSRRPPVRSSGSRSTPSTASCTTRPSRARRPPRAPASSTTATRSTPGASRSTASSGSPSSWPGSTACRRASSTATASPTSSRSPPTARSPASRNGAR